MKKTFKSYLIYFTFVIWLIPNISKAYPHFVGFGYTSCVTCHYNPFGNGPLNDYGRALSATAISARWAYHERHPEEKIATNSGFFGKISKQQWFRPSLDYRGMYIKRSVGQKTEENELINMQGDLNVVLRFGKERNFFISGSVGYAPTPLSVDSGEDVENYRTREHYVGYRPISELGIYLGLMDKIYGIRIAEHTTYGRAINDLNHNDQSHGLQVHYAKPNFELGMGYYTGNMVQEEDLRSTGYSVKADYIVSHQSSVGISYLSTGNDYVEKIARAFHYIGAVGKGSSVLVEIGKNTTTPVDDTNDVDETTYGFVQNYIKLNRGVYLVQAIDYSNNTNDEEYLRYGPGLQLFPMQRFELRGEFFNVKNFSEESSTKDSWDFLLQLHTWF